LVIPCSDCELVLNISRQTNFLKRCVGNGTPPKERQSPAVWHNAEATAAQGSPLLEPSVRTQGQQACSGIELPIANCVTEITLGTRNRCDRAFTTAEPRPQCSVVRRGGRCQATSNGLSFLRLMDLETARYHVGQLKDKRRRANEIEFIHYFFAGRRHAYVRAGSSASTNSKPLSANLKGGV
jgi:hypothetical protein